MDDNPTGAANGLITRAKAIILKPKEEWPRIAADPVSPADILIRYAIPLIAIGPVASLIGSQLFGYGAFGFSYKPSFMASLSGAVAQFVLSIVMVVVVAFIAAALAPKFGGQADRGQAFKWVAFGATAAWISGIFGLIPSLSILGILGLYSLYLLYVGAAPVMKVPQDKALGYTAVTVICAILLSLVAGAVTNAVGGMFGGSALRSAASGSDAGEMSGTFSIPGVGSVDMGRVEEMGRRMEQMEGGELQALTPAQMAPLLPERIGTYNRVATSSTAMGNMGSQAEATYDSGEHRFDLRIMDSAALGGFAAMAGAMNIEQSSETEDGFERVRNVDGRMVNESWSESRQRGSYGIMVADRFRIEAQGSAASFEELKAAVEGINQSQLERLAN